MASIFSDRGIGFGQDIFS